MTFLLDIYIYELVSKPPITGVNFGLKSPTLPETNSSDLKMDGWKHELSIWWSGPFSGANCWFWGAYFLDTKYSDNMMFTCLGRYYIILFGSEMLFCLYP